MSGANSFEQEEGANQMQERESISEFLLRVKRKPDILISYSYFAKASKLWNNMNGSRADRKARKERAKRIIKGLLVPCVNMKKGEIATLTNSDVGCEEMQFSVRCVGCVWKGQVYCYKGYDHDDMCLAAVVL